MGLQLDILNLALAHHGEDPTDTLDLNVMNANPRKAARFMDRARDQVLGSHHWNSATVFTSWTRTATEGGWKYPYVYLQPAKCLRVVEVDGCASWQRGVWVDPADDTIERAALNCDSEGPLNVAWVRRIGWDAIPTHMQDTLGYWLASLAGYAINGDAARAADLMKLAGNARMIAMGADAVQSGGGEVFLSSGFAALRSAAG